MSKPLVSDQVGEKSGVEFWVNIETYEQFQNYNDDSGIKVHLHPQDEVPQVGDQGFAIPASSHCLASATYTKTKSLPYPFGSCQDQTLKAYSKYSRAKCENECRSRFIASMCKCQPNHLPYIVEQQDEVLWELCDFNQTVYCVDTLASACFTK